MDGLTRQQLGELTAMAGRWNITISYTGDPDYDQGVEQGHGSAAYELERWIECQGD